MHSVPLSPHPRHSKQRLWVGLWGVNLTKRIIVAVLSLSRELS